MNQTRKVCRGGNPCQPVSMAEAACCVIQHGKYPMPELAVVVDVDYHYLKAAANPNRTDVQLQARLIAPITVAQENLALMRWMAGDAACAVLPLPDASLVSPELYEANLRTAEELGEMSAQLRRATCPTSEGGKELTIAEANRIAQKCQDLATAAMSIASIALSSVKPAMVRMSLDTPTSARRTA